MLDFKSIEVTVIDYTEEVGGSSVAYWNASNPIAGDFLYVL
jgi:hypothetical protein